MRKTVPVRTYYLEMRRKPEAVVAPPREDLRCGCVEEVPVALYRRLYESIGGRWRWVDRKLMSDAELQKIIWDPDVGIFFFYVDDVVAGFAELDGRSFAEIEVAYFGLLPEFCGRGLGTYFLHRILERAWSRSPERVWLHTCDWDHPGALNCYRKAGFAQYAEGVVDQVVLDQEAFRV